MYVYAVFTHTHTYIYIYIYIRVYTHRCIEREGDSLGSSCFWPARNLGTSAVSTPSGVFLIPMQPWLMPRHMEVQNEMCYQRYSPDGNHGQAKHLGR